ncbi:hypothetical protein K0T92_01665 [Paenibacillus oenotherae]|uniref:Uncharacterized protein n=1 Tax=Paenibacillus oenotherae TaxID=1435645 RepID=A0ABS7D0J0_9BACL|nr:hypothetical protein [Paenibacillus oenotherae]MBW7473449.1 hypothetical protein [Paenibacillus oenotherae]
MSVWRRILLASAVTAAITVSLSVLPHMKGRDAAVDSDLAVFRSAPLIRLSSDNLVDHMLGLQLQLKIIKVDWKQAVLSVDLSVDAARDNSRVWAGDMQRLLHLAFMRTSNVNRVLIRYMETIDTLQGSAHAEDERASRSADLRMLAAADARRSDQWLAEGVMGLNDENPFTDPLWRGRLRLLFSDIGSSRLQ